ncbi:type VII toxin-antitoxin system MntA family adenylyltransferase antitoxin [Salinarchaeum chitinilyticum]
MSDVATNDEIDRDGIRHVLEDHPVSLAILFGSYVEGNTHPNSDVDIAVEFDDEVDDRLDARLSLLSDLSSTLQRDDVDLGILPDLEPRIGRAAVTDGELLVGDQERADAYRERFEAAIDPRPPAGKRFDAVIERVEEALGG